MVSYQYPCGKTHSETNYAIHLHAFCAHRVPDSPASKVLSPCLLSGPRRERTGAGNDCQKGSRPWLTTLPGLLGQYSTGFITHFLEHPGSTRTMPTRGSCPRPPNPSQDQPALVETCSAIGSDLEVPGSLLGADGHCWEGPHSADTIHTQMASSHSKGWGSTLGIPASTSEEQQVQGCAHLSCQSPLTQRLIPFREVTLGASRFT